MTFRPNLDSLTISTSPIASRQEGGIKTQIAPDRVTKVPLFTIVTVVYNGAAIVENTIQSVLDLGFEDIEYIIIDGCSQDRTLEILKKYEDRLYYWLSEPDCGLYDAMNKGIALARGRFVGILNAGDTYTRDALTEIAKAYEREGKIGVYTGDCQSFLNDRGDAIIYAGRCTLPDRTIPHPSTFVPLSVYQQYGVFDTDLKIAADYELLCRFHQQRVPFIHVPHLTTIASAPGVSGKLWAMWQECLQVRLRHHPSRWRAIALSMVESIKLIVKSILQWLNLWQAIESRKNGTIY